MAAMSILDNLNAVAAAAFRLAADMLDGPERLHHDYDLPVADAGAERLAELEQEREAWEANELFDQMASGIRTACGPYVRLPEWFGGPYPVSSVLMPDGSLSTKRYQSSPLAGVQRAASPEGVSDETPDTPPPSGRTERPIHSEVATLITRVWVDGTHLGYHWADPIASQLLANYHITRK